MTSSMRCGGAGVAKDQRGEHFRKHERHIKDHSSHENQKANYRSQYKKNDWPSTGIESTGSTVSEHKRYDRYHSVHHNESRYASEN